MKYLQGKIYFPIQNNIIDSFDHAYSLMFLKFIDFILKHTTFSNGEGDILVSSVRVNETKTGYAEVFREDMDLIELDIKMSYWKYYIIIIKCLCKKEKLKSPITLY